MRALLAWQKIKPDVDNRKNDRYSLLIYGNSLIYSCFFNAGSYDHHYFWMERVLFQNLCFVGFFFILHVVYSTCILVTYSLVLPANWTTELHAVLLLIVKRLVNVWTHSYDVLWLRILNSSLLRWTSIYRINSIILLWNLSNNKIHSCTLPDHMHICLKYIPINIMWILIDVE